MEKGLGYTPEQEQLYAQMRPLFEHPPNLEAIRLALSAARERGEMIIEEIKPEEREVI